MQGSAVEDSTLRQKKFKITPYKTNIKPFLQKRFPNTDPVK